MPYSWLATYSSSVDLESLLLTIRARSPKGYDDAMQIINAALDNQRKQIAGFGPQGMVVQGTTEFDKTYEHPISALSSGEKQMLLLIGFVAATLHEGGIVLIDEPDLHIHIVMVPQILGSIEDIVRKRGGQLIVASHSEEVWDRFPLESEHVELAPWRRAES
jgi:predicted ATPase